MTQRHSAPKGSFGAHLDEVVKHFPDEARQAADRRKRDARELREQRDIHALLFEKAWRMERQDEG